MEKALKELLRLPEAAQLYRQRNQRQQQHSPHKQCFRESRKRVKPAKPCPHRRVVSQSGHFRPGGSAGQLNWIAEYPEQHRIPQVAQKKQHQSWARKSQLATCARRPRRDQSNVPAPSSAARPPGPEIESTHWMALLRDRQKRPHATRILILRWAGSRVNVRAGQSAAT